jgi:hypothetical protein
MTSPYDIPDEREAKLPKWAREELESQRSARRLAEKKLKDHLRTVEPTRIWYGSFDNPVYVPEDRGYQNIHFTHEGSDGYGEIQVRINRQGLLEINGGHQLVIEMQSSNCFQVRGKDTRAR